MTTPTLRNLFAGKYGILSKEEFREVQPLLKKALEGASPMVNAFKREYSRTRPYVTDKSLHPCVKRPGGQMSYPSLHAFSGYLGACILKEIFPDRAKEIFEYGKQVGRYRMIIGVHHPSDVIAGWNLAEQVCDIYKTKAAFQKSVARVASKCEKSLE